MRGNKLLVLSVSAWLSYPCFLKGGCLSIRQKALTNPSKYSAGTPVGAQVHLGYKCCARSHRDGRKRPRELLPLQSMSFRNRIEMSKS